MCRLLLLGIFLISSGLLKAQELNCNVVVNSSQIQTSDRRIFDDMERAIAQFMNQRRWTEDEFGSEERIDCNMIINLQDMPEIGSFIATVQVQSARPVYGSDYNSLLFNFADRDWAFRYNESQPMDFNRNSFISNLTSMLAFYAYVIIGMDYDTFSELGGTPYFQIAQNLVTNAQGANEPGWKPFQSSDRRNRYWLAEGLMNQQFEDFRRGMYMYHRQGMDLLTQDPEEARKSALKMLEELQKANRTSPNNILVISFLDSKRDEIVNLFGQGDIGVRRQAFNILSRIDPTNSSDYEQILQN
ncbi:DUF4835 family protein [Roseivirga sp. BDSF3-8]|uniref:type IX secretion system protein PorD n=1 Tax=Roseivirga sp. BDSF3-8 TaxID=3241598 RepID=UPI003531DEC2